MKIEVIEIDSPIARLKIGNKEIELTEQEAKELRDKLIFITKMEPIRVKEYIPYYQHWPWWNQWQQYQNPGLSGSGQYGIGNLGSGSNQAVGGDLLTSGYMQNMQ